MTISWLQLQANSSVFHLLLLLLLSLVVWAESCWSLGVIIAYYDELPSLCSALHPQSLLFLPL